MKRLLHREKKFTGEWLKTKQYFVSVLMDVVIICVLTGVKWKWGSIPVGKDEVTLGFMMYCVRKFSFGFCCYKFNFYNSAFLCLELKRSYTFG